MEKIVHIPARKANAACFGFPGLSLIVVSTKGRSVWTAPEVEAVLTHERMHIRQLHGPIKVVFLLGCKKLQRKGLEMKAKGDKRGDKVLQAGLAMRFAGFNVLSYVMERLADRGARNRGYGVELASALEKTPASKLSYVFSALGGTLHPTTKSRVKRLVK